MKLDIQSITKMIIYFACFLSKLHSVLIYSLYSPSFLILHFLIQILTREAHQHCKIIIPFALYQTMPNLLLVVHSASHKSIYL